VVRSRRLITVSNLLSGVRLLLAPVFAWFLFSGAWMAAVWVFCAASLSDFLDGYFARRFREQTVAGQYLDPLADKAFLLAALGAFGFGIVPVPQWFVWFVFVRELIIVAGSCVVVAVTGRAVYPSLWGKLTTVVYLALIGLGVIYRLLGFSFGRGFFFFLYGVFGVALISLLDYLIFGVRALRKR